MSLKLKVYPETCVAVLRGDRVVTASWFGRWTRRPYLYPLIGPGGRELTRLDHPEDPVTHAHHKSVWIGHYDVGGIDFWGETPKSGSVVQESFRLGQDEGEVVDFELLCQWRSPSQDLVMKERRRVRCFDLGGEELAVELDLEWSAVDKPIVLGATPFGPLGIRVARTIRVHEGLGGLIFNSEEAENEAGCFAQHATWCDYSGPVPVRGGNGTARVESDAGQLDAAVVGVVCFDHPKNSAEGTLWHVRDDGWMGPSATRLQPRRIEPAKSLTLRYRLEAHAGRPWTAHIGERYRRWRKQT